MADPRPDYSGVQSGLDMTKLPLYGQDDEQMQNLQKAQQEALDALQKRYDQPNWWNVAAGFAKPQLGGFLASAGSAAEAMGQNVEAQRAQQLPIAQMKLQLAQSNMLLGANKKVADQVKAWRDANPGQTPSESQIGEWESMAPGSSVVTSLKNELKTQQEKQGLSVQARASDISAAQSRINVLLEQARAQNRQPTPSEQEEINSLSQHITKSLPKRDTEPTVNNPTKTYITDGNVSIAANAYHPISTDGKQGDAIDVNPSLTPDQTDLLQTQGWQQTDAQNNPGHWERMSSSKSGAASTTPMPAAPSVSATKQAIKYSQTAPMPDVTNFGEKTQQAILQQWNEKTRTIEKPFEDQISNLQPLMTGENYATTKSVYKSTLGMLGGEHADWAKDVLAQMRQSGTEAALNQGLGVNLGSVHGSVSLPIAAYKDASWPPEKQAFADALFANLQSLATTNTKMQGGSIANTPQQEYMNVLHQFANKDMNALAVQKLVAHNQASFDHNKEIYDQIQQERGPVNASGTATPLADIFAQSKPLKTIESKYLKIHNSIDRQFQDSLISKPSKAAP